ncbi:MAG: oxalate:formate antiporter [Gemmatimonadota bacterium]
MADDVRLQSPSASSKAENSNKVQVMLAWTFVLVPLAWGLTQTLIKAAALFT